MNATLGKKVQDRITGFKGIAVARVEYLNDRTSIGVQSQELKDGKPIDTEYFDEGRIEMLMTDEGALKTFAERREAKAWAEENVDPSPARMVIADEPGFRPPLSS